MRAFDVCTDICTYVFSCDDEPSITRLKVILFASNFCALQSRAAKGRQVRCVACTSGSLSGGCEGFIPPHTDTQT